MERQPGSSAQEAQQRDAEINQQRRTASGLFAASIMAESMIRLAANTEPNPLVRIRRKRQLHNMWLTFRTQLIGRATTRGVFGR